VIRIIRREVSTPSLVTVAIVAAIASAAVVALWTVGR
jgi:hypothetical protein